MNDLKKFWDWMDEKEYGYLYLDEQTIYGLKRTQTKQMLIGFMIEYLCDNGYWSQYIHVRGDTTIDAIFGQLYQAVVRFEDKTAISGMQKVGEMGDIDVFANVDSKEDKE